MTKAVTSDIEFIIAGYIIHSPIQGIIPSEYEHFWQFPAKIISHCQRFRGLHAFTIHCNDDYPPALINKCERTLEAEDWLLRNFKVYYPDFGDSIDGTTRVMLGIHSNTGASEPL